MLYVSRRKGLRDIGVVDTDDNVEEIVSVDRARDLSLDGTVHIHGVSNNQWTMTVGVFPYQSEESMTRQQTKMKVLCHTDIRVWRNYITDIFFEPRDVKKPVEIILSDFGKVLADRVLDNCSSRVRNHKVTLVFDDNVSVLSHALLSRDSTVPICIYNYGVNIDVTRVTDIDTLCMIYLQLFQGCFRYNGGEMDSNVRASIKDERNRRRKLLVVCERALTDTLFRSGSDKSLKSLIKHMKELYSVRGV